ncbi:MAG: hypothetical protein ACD_45C00481G0001 [uncultured bacterium]|nr:MAG: hypothetical protein ACD_45C00481G0001 [uncultured bacterium]
MKHRYILAIFLGSMLSIAYSQTIHEGMDMSGSSTTQKLDNHTVTETLMVMLGVPFALFGGFILLLLLGYNMSVAVWVGFIALAGVAAETSAVMLVYLDYDYGQKMKKGTMKSLSDLIQTVQQCAVSRIRPMMMAGLANILGLLPVMWATGIGADVMKRLAAPMVGGVFSALLLTLIVIPVLYVIWRWNTEENL